MAGDMISIILSSGKITISFVPEVWKHVWEKWDVHGVILFSLFLQIFLIFFAASRKRTKGYLLLLIWFAYLLADWAASYCVGLISNNRKSKLSTENTIKDHLFAFWSPFLLLHLGGPDTITAYALEDNELWVRHLMSLINQSATAGYIFFLTVRDNSLWMPTILVFVAGIIKYTERTCSLYIASFNAFRQSLVPDPGPDHGKLIEEFYSRKRAGLPVQIVTLPELETQRTVGISGEGKTSDDINQLEAVQKGFYFFKKFKGVIVDMIYSFEDRHESREYFKNKKAEEVLQVLEIELNFMYEAFYTKVTIVRKGFGYFCKFVSFASVLLALGFFILEEKDGLEQFDISVTYALLYGALALDTIAFFMLIVTEYTAIFPQEKGQDLKQASRFQRFKMSLLKLLNDKVLVLFFRAKKPYWKEIEREKDYIYEGYHRLSTKARYRRWFGSITGYNLMEYSLTLSVQKVPRNLNDRSRIVGFILRVWCKIVQFVQDCFYSTVANSCSILRDLIEHLRFKHDKPFLKELWQFIFKEVKKRSEDIEEDTEMIRSMCCVRGEWVMEKELDKESRDKLMPFVDSNQVAFDQSLILWHIATCLCYYYEDGDHRSKDKRCFSMILSDYLIYLLMVQPKIMSSVAGIGQIRFYSTSEEAKRFFSRRKQLEQIEDRWRLERACQDIMDVLKDVNSDDLKGEWSISLLFEACRLAKELNSIENKWDIIASVWVELLMFAATQCRPTAHVRVLSEGGELVTLVWLLMFHLGLGNFQFKDSKAKLLNAKVLPLV